MVKYNETGTVYNIIDSYSQWNNPFKLESQFFYIWVLII